LSELTSLQSDLAEHMTRFGSARRDLKGFEEEYGTEDELEKTLRRTSDKIRKLESEREETNSKERVILDGLEYLQEFTPAKCPICEEKIDAEEACNHLREEVREVVGEKLKQLDRSITDLKTAKGELENLVGTWQDLKENLEKAKAKVDSALEDIANALGQPISSAKKGMKLVEDKCSELQSRKEKLEKPMRKREEELQGIELWVAQMEAIAEGLRWDERRNKLAKLQKEKAFKNVDKTLKALGELEALVGMIAESIQHVQGESAKSLVEDAMPQIKKFYEELVGHPYYRELQIEVTPRKTRGGIRNSYMIIGLNPTDGAETLAKDRFSTGQMNCVALSIFLAMAHKDAFSHNLDFLVLDDPSQSLDTEHKEALCKILARVAKKRQLAVSSQDNEFQKLLDSTFKGQKVIKHEFEKWSIEGPNIKTV
jgi:DNA repair exonuclease SbcCD ATPase subunit